MTAPATVGIPVARPRRRGTEAVLLCGGALVTLAATVAVGLGADARITAFEWQAPLELLVATLLAHLAIRRLAPYADPLLLPLATVLNGVGLAEIHRLDLAAAASARAVGHRLPAADGPLQLIWSGLGLALFVVVLACVRDHRTVARYSYTAALAGLALLLLPSVLPARYSEVNGARSWLRFAGFSLQPGEIAKLLLMVFFAGYLVRKRQVLSVVTRSVAGLELPRGRDLGPLLAAWAVAMVVLGREKDIGMALLYFGIFLVMLYIATARASWLVLGMGLFGAGLAVAYQLFGHVRERFDIWLHAFSGANPTNHSYQLVQGLFGFATGGVLGTGLGRGQPQDVPFARTDFIFAALGEELGLVGVFAILLVYLLFTARGLRAAVGVRDSFGKLLAGGLASAVALQVFVVVGGVMRVIPLTGLTLPWLAYGGSSVVTNYILLALLVRISDAGRAPAAGFGVRPGTVGDRDAAGVGAARPPERPDPTPGSPTGRGDGDALTQVVRR